MSIEKLKKQLEKLEDGATYLTLLDGGLESLYSEINAGKAFIKSAKKVLGENEAEYQDKANKLAEYDKLEAKYTLLETQYNGLQGENKAIKRESVLSALCTKEDVNKETLQVLLPTDLEITDKGVKLPASEGVEAKEVSLKEYINSDPKLKIFSDSLYKKAEPKTKEGQTPPPIISNEMGESKPPKGAADAALDMVSNRQKDRLERVSSRFKTAK